MNWNKNNYPSIVNHFSHHNLLTHLFPYWQFLLQNNKSHRLLVLDVWHELMLHLLGFCHDLHTKQKGKKVKWDIQMRILTNNSRTNMVYRVIYIYIYLHPWVQIIKDLMVIKINPICKIAQASHGTLHTVVVLIKFQNLNTLNLAVL